MLYLSSPGYPVLKSSVCPSTWILLQALTAHCLNSALSQLQSIRSMAMTNCLYLLIYAQQPPPGRVDSMGLLESFLPVIHPSPCQPHFPCIAILFELIGMYKAALSL